jgi:hypothetical protein
MHKQFFIVTSLLISIATSLCTQYALAMAAETGFRNADIEEQAGVTQIRRVQQNELDTLGARMRQIRVTDREYLIKRDTKIVVGIFASGLALPSACMYYACSADPYSECAIASGIFFALGSTAASYIAWKSYQLLQRLRTQR